MEAEQKSENCETETEQKSESWKLKEISLVMSEKKGKENRQARESCGTGQKNSKEESWENQIKSQVQLRVMGMARTKGDYG